MEMNDANADLFLDKLVKMSAYFCDQLDAERIQTYVEMLMPQVELVEWEYARKQAIRRHAIYKVPTIAEFMGYVEEYRTVQREQASAQRRRQHLLEQPALTTDEMQAQVQHLLATLNRDVAMPANEPPLTQTLDY